jgi:hypothetical protein
LESLDSQVIKEIGKENKQLVNLRQKAMSTVRDIRIGEGLSQAEKAKLLKDKRASAVLSRRVSSKGDARRIWRSFQSKTTGGFMAMPGETSGAVTPQQKAAETRRRNAEIKAATTQAQQDKRSAYNARRRERYAEQRAAAQSAAQPVAKKPGIGSRIASGVKGGMARIGPMGGMMAAGAVGAGVSMIPGLEGLGMGISIIGPLLMMLPGPIGLAVAALGLLGAGIFASIKAQEEQRKKAIELGNAQVTSISSMNKMAEEMGTVSATQARESEMSAKLTKVKEEELTAGQQYIRETASGQKILSDVKALQASGESTEQIAETVASNLANAVAQNVITQQQGNEIIAALGVESGNFGVSSGASAQFGKYTADLTKTSGMTAEAGLATIRNQVAANSAEYTSAYDQNVTEQILEAINPVAIFADATGTSRKSQARNDRLQTATSSINTYGQAVGGIDAINAQYEVLLAQAKTQKEISELESQRKIDLDNQKQVASDIYGEIIKQKDAIGDAEFSRNFLDSIKTTFSEDSPAYKTAQAINQLGESDFKLRLQAQLESGTLSPQSIDVLLGNAATDKEFGSAYTLAIETIGEIETLNMVSSLQAAGVSVTRQTHILEIVEASGSQELANIISMAAIGEEGVNVSATIDYIDKNADKVLADWESWEGMSDEEKTVRLQFETNGFSLTKDQWNEYAGLPDYQQKAFVTKYVTEELELRATFTMSNGVFNLRGYEAARDRLYGEAMETARSTSAPITDGDGDGDGGGGGGEKEDKKLAGFNKKMDKRQKALNVIKLREDAINKKYDERRKSLEEIAKINAQISEQQRAQLDIAGALASGDIAAAARAVQTERARAAGFAQEQQMKALEDQRQKELENISFKGMTRKSLEAAIAGLAMSIAKREYTLAASGGMIRMAGGGKVMSYFAAGGKPLGSDTVPAMLTPGEFVVKRPAVQSFGVKNLEKINSGKSPSGSVYTYNVSVNVATGSDPEKIARSVVTKIKSIDKQRLGGNNY